MYNNELDESQAFARAQAYDILYAHMKDCAQCMAAYENFYDKGIVEYAKKLYCDEGFPLWKAWYDLP